ncbi:hypothetical protein [Nocardia ninae]|nr:hypothetical protein [Nocardia ninae]
MHGKKMKLRRVADDGTADVFDIEAMDLGPQHGITFRADADVEDGDEVTDTLPNGKSKTMRLREVHVHQSPFGDSALDHTAAKYDVISGKAALSSRSTNPGVGNYITYHGPVVQMTGDGSTAQLAWGNRGPVNQGQSTASQIAPGYEQLATVLTDLLAQLPALGLATDDDTDFRETTETVLAEVVREEPNQGLIRRSVAALKGYLAQIAAGTAQAATDEATEFARTAIEGLSDSLPF